MKDDTCSKATKYAEELMMAKTLDELASISTRIKANLGELIGFEGWLRDIWKSAYDTLYVPNKSFKEGLSVVGKVALK